jgi:hypothetical protein
MCRTDGEAADAYCVTHPLARKPHRCGECGRTILAGEPYERHSLVYDGTASSHAVCTHCAVLAEWIGRECGGTTVHELLGDIEEHAFEYGRADLQELADAARAHWSWPEGSRLNGFAGKPVPALPPPLVQSEKQT